MKKEMTCNLCNKRDKCKQLCSSMLEKLKNAKKNNKMYCETTTHKYNKHIGNTKELSAIIYSYGLSNVENRDAKRVIIALLTKEQKKIIDLYSKGYTQKEIAKKLKVSQSNISQRIEAIKEELRKSFIEIIPCIVNK